MLFKLIMQCIREISRMIEEWTFVDMSEFSFKKNTESYKYVRF